MKKFICMIISIVMVFTMIPMFGVQVFAAEVVAAKIGDMEFNTLQSAVTYAVNTTSAVTVSLEKNVIENITVASGNCVTLDLNGNVIKGTGISSVIKIEDGANLTIIDSGSNSFVHYYTVNNRGIWTWNDKVTEGAIAFESLSETPSARTVIAVSGGAITGGNGSSYESPISYKCGGGVTVVSGGSLIMQGGNIIGNVAQIGGGIFSFQSVAFSVENIRVAGNYAEDCGGGLSVYDCDTNITNASISFNFAGEKEYLWYEDGFGGGIYAYSYYVERENKLNINNSKVLGNISGTNGGGIQIGVNSNSTLKISTVSAVMNNCTISNNTSYGNGGGLYCYSYEYYGERKVTIFELNECILSNNTASANGGGIYNKGEFNVINSEIFNNNASNGGGIYSISGFNYSNFLKQISIYGSEVTGTAISNNKAIGFGGGVFCTSDISLEGKIDISNNFASRGTNNLLCDSEDSSIELNNITQSSIGISLFNNSSIAVGQITSTGDQYIQSFFPDNSKTSIVASDGGLCLKLKTSSQDVARIVTGSCVATFSSVQAAVDAAASGDAIELLSDSYENAVIVSNTALSLDLKGFVISGDFNGGDNIFEIINHGNLTIKDTGSGTRNHYFLFNKDYAWGWDDSVSIGSITIDDVNNSTALWTPVKLSRGCITGGNAGGIYISSNSTLNLEDAAIIGCCVDGCGAGIYNNGKVIINDALIAGNSAGDEGAGVYNSCEAFIDNTIFHSNTCIDDGAGIYNYNGGMITISGGAFSYNKADEAGGIYNEYNGIITMSGVNFVYNVSVEEGGALKNNGDINIFGGSFVGNRNEIEGGAIYNSERMSLYDVLVECNYSGQYGGGIYNSDTLVVSNCAIKDNSSIMGGGLFNSEGTCYINGGKVVGNTLHSGGNMGAGVLNAGDLVLSGEVDISGNAYGEIKSNLAELKMDGYGCFTSISFGNDGIFGNSNIGTTLLTMISQFTIGPTSGDIAEEGAEYAEYFFADDDDYEVVENAPGLALVQAAPVNVTLHATNGTINKFQGDSVKAGSRVTSDGGILQIGSVTYIAAPNDGYKFSKWTVSPNANVITTNTSITATFEVIPSVIQYVNTGGGGGAASYAVGKNAVQNGTLTLSQTSAEGGTSIKVTAVPNKGYKLKTLSVQDGLGNAIAYTVDSSTEYHFVMPARKVTVSAEFEKETVKAECTRDDNCVIAKFEDLSPARWYHEGIHFCVERGYMEGETKTKFNPFGTLNRGMMVRLLYNIDGKPAVSGPSTFTDVASGRWFTDAIAWAEANKLIEGNGKGQFNLEGDMTREMLITLMYNYAKLKGCDVSKTGSLEKYPDASKLSKWSVDAFKWATANGIMDGKSDGTLDPKGSATRVEAAVLIQQFMEVFEK